MKKLVLLTILSGMLAGLQAQDILPFDMEGTWVLVMSFACVSIVQVDSAALLN
jgi:hypothetical protein